jgi:branched-chain amino acid transport system permease protein
MKGLIFLLSMHIGRPVMELIRYRHRRKKMPGRYVEVMGKSIYYREKGSGKPVLYIHGNIGSHEWFREVMDLPGCRTIAPDMINFGHSDHIETSDIEVYADYIKGFMDALQITDALVAGHSLGGAVAMSLAVKEPDLVRKLVLIDSCPPDGLKTPEAHYPYIELYKKSRGFLKKALAGVMPSRDDKKLLNLLVNEAMLMNKSSYTGNARALEKVDFTDRLSSFGKPVLVVAGKLDALITAEMAEQTAAAFGGEYRIIDGVGHSLMVENPELFKEVLLGFDS